jgi:hypothetical protein
MSFRFRELNKLFGRHLSRIRIRDMHKIFKEIFRSNHRIFVFVQITIKEKYAA